MKRHQIKPGQYFLSSIGLSDRNIGTDFDGEYLMRVTAVTGDMVEQFNVTCGDIDTPVDIDELLGSDTRAVDASMAARLVRLQFSFAHEQAIANAESLMRAYDQRGEI